MRVASHVEPLFEQSKAYKVGSTIPIKVQLLNAGNANASAASVPLTARSVRLIGGTTVVTVTDAGNANPDSNFRYDSTVGGTGGYIFNLSTKGLSAGRYVLSFYAGTERAFFYSVEFQLR